MFCFTPNASPSAYDQPPRRLRPRLCGLLVAAVVFASATSSTQAETVALEARDFSINAPAGWQTTATDGSLERVYAELAEPILQQLIGTPPPVLSYVRGIQVATSPSGQNLVVAVSQLIAGDAEQAVLALRRGMNERQWPQPRDYRVQSVLAIEADRIGQQPATRFEIELVDGTLVYGVAFALPERPDALAAMVFVVNDPSSFDFAGLQSSIESIRVGATEPKPPADGGGGITLRGALRSFWSPAGGSESLVWVQRIAAMVLIFCVIFASLLKLALVVMRRLHPSPLRAAKRDDEEKKEDEPDSEEESPLEPEAAARFRSEAFLLPIALASITLTALLVLWLVGA